MYKQRSKLLYIKRSFKHDQSYPSTVIVVTVTFFGVICISSLRLYIVKFDSSGSMSGKKIMQKAIKNIFKKMKGDVGMAMPKTKEIS